MIWAFTFADGMVLGLLVGRWWGLLAVLPFSTYIALETEVDLPPVLLASFYGTFAAAGIAAGVYLRRTRRGASSQRLSGE